MCDRRVLVWSVSVTTCNMHVNIMTQVWQKGQSSRTCKADASLRTSTTVIQSSGSLSLVVASSIAVKSASSCRKSPLKPINNIWPAVNSLEPSVDRDDSGAPWSSSSNRLRSCFTRATGSEWRGCGQRERNNWETRDIWERTGISGWSET